MKYLFRENNNEVKVNKILDLYRKLLNETNNRSKCIMLSSKCNIKIKLWKRIKYRYKWRIKYNYI